MGLVQDRRLVFENAVREMHISKRCSSKSNSYLAGYLARYHYWDMDILDETIDKLQKAINGGFNQIGDPDIGMEFYNITITSDNVEVRRETPPYTIVETFSLIDMKNLLDAWRTFLLTPPLAGTKVR